MRSDRTTKSATPPLLEGGSEFSRRAGDSAGGRTHVQPRRGPPERAARGGDFLWLVAKPFRRRPQSGGPDHPNRRYADPGGGSAASDFRDADPDQGRCAAARGAERSHRASGPCLACLWALETGHFTNAGVSSVRTTFRPGARNGAAAIPKRSFDAGASGARPAGGRGAISVARAVRGGAVGVADLVREHRQSAGGASSGARPRDGDADGVGRVAGASRGRP